MMKVQGPHFGHVCCLTTMTEKKLLKFNNEQLFGKNLGTLIKAASAFWKILAFVFSDALGIQPRMTNSQEMEFFSITFQKLVQFLFLSLFGPFF